MTDNPPVETPMEAIDRRAREGRVPVQLGDLFGPDGNAFAVLVHCKDALRDWDRATGDAQYARWPAIEADMKSGDYDHLLEVVDREFRVVARDHRGRLHEYPEWLDDYRAHAAANAATFADAAAEEDE